MDYRRTYVRDLFDMPPGTATSAYGWVKTRRDSKGISFVQISDGSCFKDFQVIVNEGVLSSDDLKLLTTGACVRFDGKIVESPAAGQAVEMQAEAVEVFGAADPQTYPLQKKGATMEYLREIAHLRARGNTFGAVFRVRNRAAFAIHKFFQTRGFHYVHTPIITASDAEGAGAMFQVTTAVETVEKAVEGGTEHQAAYRIRNANPKEDFFGKPSYLTVSGQLEAETLAMGMTNVYTFGPTFRAENSSTSRHAAEFWMVEPEMAFCDLEGDMNLAEEFLKEVVADLLDQCGDDLSFFNQRIEKELLETLQHVVSSPFERLTYTEAVKLLETSGESFEFPVHWGADLQSEHERWLTETKVGRPVILTDYPKEIKAFYMRANEDGKTVRAMDVLAPRIGEIMGGSQREERLDVLESRITEMGLPLEPYWWYLDLRRFGTAPHAGFGLGFERLLMYVTGMKNIRDVIPYHRTPGHAEF
ncbi:asparagine--tRNA ligase [Fimbriimonas ginsengisoli]|uniref:Asparagine--tRNA ligase n=1 Tax=Fimbriimonas ginsengisoli Gsoil 348 TaxID=661478 RepID=A0A068NNT1_FIMGI|nr:asparagine--tRNA ligase [Fimbriimonas ginsengisoli]AIE85081.1 asparaginyl-tRNA synthetase [Fimbriimonas ginsengisoli Gsoil 348]